MVDEMIFEVDGETLKPCLFPPVTVQLGSNRHLKQGNWLTRKRRLAKLALKLRDPLMERGIHLRDLRWTMILSKEIANKWGWMDGATIYLTYIGSIPIYIDRTLTGQRAFASGKLVPGEQNE